MSDDPVRMESDSLGEIAVPESAYWGAQTQRAVENFPISGKTMDRRVIWALGVLKRGAAAANEELGHLDPAVAEPIKAAATEVAEGTHDDQFPVDVYQTGSGTSTNMNANEVIANRASELANGDITVHPNDHVNFGQSSNDVIPTVMHMAIVDAIQTALRPALETLEAELREKEHEFDAVVKTGRTHLQDATPVTLGQEFGGYRTQVTKGIERLDTVLPQITELALGGTATGTGLNTDEEFPRLAIEHVSEKTGYPFREAENHFEAQSAHDAINDVHGAVETIAGALNKIANDCRLMASGPRNGLGELKQPENQPGSSIMPGKVNPVVAESVNQVHKRIVGNDATVGAATPRGELELNLYKTVLVDTILESIRLLANVSTVFAERFIANLEANRKHCNEQVEQSMALATALNPHVGYDAATEIAKTALAEDRSIREVAIESGHVTPDEADEILDPMEMVERGILGGTTEQT